MEIDINNKKVEELIKNLIKKGAECYIVGGYVRDSLLGIKTKDIDIEVHGMSFEGISKEIKGIKNEKFGVITLKEYGVDFAIPRKEYKTGNFYNDFNIELNPYLDLKSSAKRRDFSINTLMYDFEKKIMIDNFGGIEDLKKKRIKHISKSFVEDPLRALRAIRFSVNLNFQIDEKTYELCQEMIHELNYVTIKKKSSELNKILLSNRNNIINQIKSLELLSLYIGNFNKAYLETICSKEFKYKKELLKVLLFKDNKGRIKEFIIKEKEQKNIKKLIEVLEVLEKNSSKEEIYIEFLSVRNQIDLFLELLEVFEVNEKSKEIFLKIKNIYEKVDWEKEFKSNIKKNKNFLKKDYVLNKLEK